jgi:hypothetical protein
MLLNCPQYGRAVNPVSSLLELPTRGMIASGAENVTQAHRREPSSKTAGSFVCAPVPGVQRLASKRGPRCCASG